jgi:hypothetical protein
MTRPTITLALLTRFLHTCGFERLVWCGGELSCFTANRRRWTNAAIHKSAEDTGDAQLMLAWELTQAALEGHDQPFTLIMGAHPPEKERQERP